MTDGYVVHLPMVIVFVPKTCGHSPFKWANFMAYRRLTSMGVILTTYDTWDDPPQVDLSSWSYHSPGKSTETCCTPQKSNELIPRIAMFTGSYLFQPIILSIHVSFRGCICFMNPFSTSHITIKNKSMMRKRIWWRNKIQERWSIDVFFKRMYFFPAWLPEQWKESIQNFMKFGSHASDQCSQLPWIYHFLQLQGIPVFPGKPKRTDFHVERMDSDLHFPVHWRGVSCFANRGETGDMSTRKSNAQSYKHISDNRHTNWTCFLWPTGHQAMCRQETQGPVQTFLD